LIDNLLGAEVNLRKIGIRIATRYLTLSFVAAMSLGFAPAKARATELTPPVVVGDMVVGSALSVETHSLPDGANVNFQWLRSFEPIPSATSPTYDVKAEDFGESITVRETFREDNQESVLYSVPQGLVASSPGLPFRF